MSVSYRKTQAGKWVVFGPVAEVREGQVTVTKKDRSTKIETVVSVGKPFLVNGIQHRYGYLQEKQVSSRSRYGHGRTNSYGQRLCIDCGGVIDPSLDGAFYGAPGYCFDCA